ncbi:unnamed protein product [Mytilus coruscus]|uniref:Uncharacterized protein n=1 Tax=Mytilus coruscus TaxID=42192 RepID=A0A6J8BP10_MYTCO|nr:unnamed protein product [Mytilus coruscus]
MESGRNRLYRRLFKTAQQNIVKKINYTAKSYPGQGLRNGVRAVTGGSTEGSSRRLNKTSLRRSTTLQELSGSVTQKWSQAVTGSTEGSSRRLNKTSLRRSTTLQELSGSVTQKWSQAVTGSNNSILLQKQYVLKKKIVKKTNYTARVIRVSDSEMESGRNRQYRRLFKTAQQNIVKKINYTARVIRVSYSEMESGRKPAVQRLFKTINKTSLNRPTTLQELSGSVTRNGVRAVTGSNNSIFTTKTVRTKEKIVKKTNYTARVIRVSDSRMGQAVTGSTEGSSRWLNKTSLRRSTTLQELSRSVTQNGRMGVTGSTASSSRRIKTK